MFPALLRLPFGIFPGLFRDRTFLRRLQLDTGTARLGQPDGNSLFSIPCSMFSFTDLIYFIADKLTRLGAGRLASLFVTLCPLNGFFVWHKDVLGGRCN